MKIHVKPVYLRFFCLSSLACQIPAPKGLPPKTALILFKISAGFFKYHVSIIRRLSGCQQQTYSHTRIFICQTDLCQQRGRQFILFNTVHDRLKKLGLRRKTKKFGELSEKSEKILQKTAVFADSGGIKIALMQCIPDLCRFYLKIPVLSKTPQTPRPPLSGGLQSISADLKTNCNKTRTGNLKSNRYNMKTPVFFQCHFKACLAL